MKIAIHNRHALIPAIYLVLLSTTLMAVTFEGKNVLFIGLSIIGGIVLTIVYFRSFPVSGEVFPVLLLTYMLVSAFVNLETSQLTSVLYSVFFIVSYLLYTPFIKHYFSVDDYANILRFLIILFFAGLVASQVYLFLFGFNPTHTSGDIVHGSMGMQMEKGKLRFHSFASEPSYASFIVITFFYSYTRIRKSLTAPGTLGLLAMVVYMIFFFRSGYGAVLFVLFLMSFLGLSRRAIAGLVLIALLSALALSNLSELPFVERVLRIIERTDWSNPHTLYAVDYSVYYRVAPVLHYARIVDLMDWHYWLGWGAAASRNIAIPETWLASEGVFLGGFIPAFFFDYGLIGSLLVLTFIGRMIPRLISIPSAIVLLMIFNSNFNTQLFWIVITFFSLNAYFVRQEQPSVSPAMA